MGSYDRLKEVITLLPDKARVTLDFGKRSLEDSALESMLSGLGIESCTFEISSIIEMSKDQILKLVEYMDTQPRLPYCFEKIECRVENPESGGARIVVTPRNITINYISHHSDKMSDTLKKLLTEFGALGIIDAEIQL